MVLVIVLDRVRGRIEYEYENAEMLVSQTVTSQVVFAAKHNRIDSPGKCKGYTVDSLSHALHGNLRDTECDNLACAGVCCLARFRRRL